MFSSVGLPHGFCFLWNPGLLWLNVASDSLIALAYFLIPVALIRIVLRRRDIRLDGMFFCFAAFILACGLTHVMEVVTLWHPIYWISGALKAVTAAISLATFVLVARVSSLDFSMFEKLFQFSPDAVFVVDHEGRIQDSNARAEELFGYSHLELSNRPIESLIPERFREGHPQHLQRYHSQPCPRPMGAGLELSGLRKDGREVPVDIMLQPVKTPQGTLVLSFVRDVTEHRMAEKNLAHTSNQLRSVLESTIVSVIAVNSEWTIEYVNGSAKTMLHIEHDVLGKSLWTVFPEAEIASRDSLIQVMATRQPLIFESHYAPLDLYATAKIHPWENGGLTIFLTDISAHKRLERELERERGMRSQRIEALARLSSELAHEIKNPLAIIHARASDLAEIATEQETLSSDLVAKACNSIVSTSDRAIRILRGVAALAREGRNDPMEASEVRAMVEQALVLVRGRFQRQDVRLTAEVPEGLPMVECREVQIGQVLVNLLNNAFDAVDGDARSERWVRVEASVHSAVGPGGSSELLHLDVIDGGPGVPAEYRARLMETFFTTKPAGAGMGIGLSVSRSIAEDHHGRLDLLASGGHTCFRLTIPVKALETEGVAA